MAMFSIMPMPPGIPELGIPVTAAQTLMQTLEDREALARVVLATADALPKKNA